MTRMYLIRHCEAEGNLLGIFQGSTDCEISETGARQLKYLAKRFEDIYVDSVWSSPLTRALKTARAVADQKNLEIKIYEGISEMHGGKIEGKAFKDLFAQYPELSRIWTEQPHIMAPEEGESMRDVYDRIWRAVIHIAKADKGKTIALATHGGVLRCLMCKILYNDIEHLRDVEWCENTGVTLLEFDDDLNCTIKFMNDHSHVPDEFMPAGSRLSNVEELSK